MRALNIFWHVVNGCVFLSIVFMFGMAAYGSIKQYDYEKEALERLNAYYEEKLF